MMSFDDISTFLGAHTLRARRSKPDTQDHTPTEILDHLCSSIIRSSELDIERQVHDIIIRNIEYEDAGKDIDHEALGPLVYKKGVCDGISKLAKQVFDRCGVRSLVVTGILNCSNDTPGPHAWNMVNIDGYWFHLDITADLGLSGDKSSIRYDYFNLSDIEILRDHRIDTGFPVCVKSNSDYYTCAGLFMNDIEQFKAKLKQALRSDGILTVKLPYGMNPEITQKKLLECVESVCKDMGKRRYSINYSMNPDQMIFNFRIN